MKFEYQYIESNYRGYDGVFFDEREFQIILKNEVKNNLIDKLQRDEMLNILKALKEETGFEYSETLLIDIQLIQKKNVKVWEFRIGEALAEVVLGKNFSCRFYWNELRDARNPQGNKTGADLVGFIEIDRDVLFLFGEVKTSSETKTPPQVMLNRSGIEKQLKDLYDDSNKRLLLISYIQNKIGLISNSNFKQDFDNAVKNYYKENNQKYLLYGVLIRDTVPKEGDIKNSFNDLKEKILEPIGLKLLAIYSSIPKERWLEIINEVDNDSN